MMDAFVLLTSTVLRICVFSSSQKSKLANVLGSFFDRTPLAKETFFIALLSDNGEIGEYRKKFELPFPSEQTAKQQTCQNSNIAKRFRTTY